MDSTGKIWDSFYRKDHGWMFSKSPPYQPRWQTNPPADQRHRLYAIARYCGIIHADGDQQWHHQQINGCMFSQPPGTDGETDYKQDMSPNNARCNAINKIVPGYLQAFSATPGRNGQLVELWNSENGPKDAVEWFAKGSPPTIADGKVFVAEFPAKPENEKWNDANAFGRLLMYSLLRE
jgi:hypothetical protein